MEKSSKFKIIVTCEHGGNEIPPEFQEIFRDQDKLLKTHRGYDIGALQIFKKFEKLSDFSSYSTISRLLVELNRSRHHPDLFSAITKKLPQNTKNQIFTDYYLPYREKIEKKIQHFIQNKANVLHISVHTFTPVLKKIKRTADISFLYDPARILERSFCNRWIKEIRKQNPFLRVRKNYPYRGNADGFTTDLRKKFPPCSYLGIEVEVNQNYFEVSTSKAHQPIMAVLSASFPLVEPSFA